MQNVTDFTLKAYFYYLKAIKKSYPTIIRFDEYFMKSTRPKNFCIIRHDVDRFPIHALRMAILENKMGIKSTYYFRAKTHVFLPKIMKRIGDLGHEIGYHYECLSDTRGDIATAMKDFENNLSKFREIVDIKTISMHGRPHAPFDNRDIWRDKKCHSKLVNKLGILGEIYLDIDYSNIFYLTDTGRNWNSNSNVRDTVDSFINHSFFDMAELLSHISKKPDSAFIFSLHPERWPSTFWGYYRSFILDFISNLTKNIAAN